jgi:predicted nuclease with TOPRIM domain
METLMHSRKKVYLLIALVLFSTLIVQVWASPTTTVTFQGGGVTIAITFPDEAHPSDNITHEVTITSNASTVLRNFTVVIKAPANSIWQEVFTGQDTLSKPLPVNYTLPLLPLPQDANGTLQCFIYVNTTSIDDIATTIYTTHVSELTFSEMQTVYNEMLANYTLLQTDYETLLNQYDGLLAEYNSSVANYTSLLSQHTELQTKYDNEVAAYNSQLSSNNHLSQEYNNLNTNYKASLNELSATQSNYETLNTTKNNLQTNYTGLQNVYNSLNQTYSNLRAQLNTLQEKINTSTSEVNISRTFVFIALMAVAGLVALIVYLKRKKPEPYLVIRKETVAVENDENQPA